MKIEDRLPQKPSDVCGCRTCNEVFNSTRAFDAHRVGQYPDRRCMKADEMRERGMRVNALGRWVTSSNPLWQTV